jgi:hypothetical protein
MNVKYKASGKMVDVSEKDCPTLKSTGRALTPEYLYKVFGIVSDPSRSDGCEGRERRAGAPMAWLITQK